MTKNGPISAALSKYQQTSPINGFFLSDNALV
ncbi:hypothetical protein EAM_1292 [Erwinia amylovora ATCC 49946]|uniref:Uncharacterized protein n=2 Tax=Erwinia amylovora TaxID=552 RepID=D4I037_ERWAC|nr:hypothetical protein predicted by Glimmer/Critica [Erwinia amylovora CFBP1430]CBJ45967.1 hypothetical protein EAM_1292 [Erwinia amylovora ATCC 49946]CBX80151.1 hypothetical protein predicted by Glimmer/Critica [Erwinia amylovora ATCC BAA-2158]